MLSTDTEMDMDMDTDIDTDMDSDMDMDRYTEVDCRTWIRTWMAGHGLHDMDCWIQIAGHRHEHGSQDTEGKIDLPPFFSVS